MKFIYWRGTWKNKHVAARDVACSKVGPWAWAGIKHGSGRRMLWRWGLLCGAWPWPWIVLLWNITPASGFRWYVKNGQLMSSLVRMVKTYARSCKAYWRDSHGIISPFIKGGFCWWAFVYLLITFQERTLWAYFNTAFFLIPLLGSWGSFKQLV